MATLKDWLAHFFISLPVVLFVGLLGIVWYDIGFGAVLIVIAGLAAYIAISAGIGWASDHLGLGRK